MIALFYKHESSFLTCIYKYILVKKEDTFTWRVKFRLAYIDIYRTHENLPNISSWFHARTWCDDPLPMSTCGGQPPKTFLRVQQASCITIYCVGTLNELVFKNTDCAMLSKEDTNTWRVRIRLAYIDNRESMHGMHSYRMWTNKEGYALGRTQHISCVSTSVLRYFRW